MAKIRLAVDNARPTPQRNLRAVVVPRARVLGGEELPALVLIQDGPRTFHRADGRELAELAERFPCFARWAVSPLEDD